MIMDGQLRDLIKEFNNTVDAYFGVYLDSAHGFELVKKEIEEAQKKLIQINKKRKKEDPSKVYNETIEDFDSSAVIYSAGERGTPEYKMLHYCRTQGVFKERNSPSGHNYKFIGNLVVISLYQYWEDHFRAKIADYLGKDKIEMKSQIMGDLGLLRRSIIHHNGIALRDVNKCTILNWYKEGDEIFIDRQKLEQIFQHIYQWIKEL